MGICPVPLPAGISLPFHLVYIAVFWAAFLYSGSLWLLFIVELPPCGWGVDLFVKVSWLGKLALVFWWLELDFFSLECNEVSSSEF